MAMEKRFKAVPPQAFTADGTVVGQITINDTRFFKVKQVVILTANTQPNLELEVKRVLDDGETMFVGTIGKNIDERIDISAYTVALNAAIFANEQKRPSVPEQEIERLTYEEEPTVARRVVLVDQVGEKYNKQNPLPVAVDTTVNIGDVRITAEDNDPSTGNVHSSVRIGDGENEVIINEDGSINTITNGVHDLSNPVPSSTGIIAHQRNISPTSIDQTLRPTGIINGDVQALDIAIRDEDGVPFSNTNPMPVEVFSNIRQMILASADRQSTITYADFGTKNQRVTQIDYTSATVYSGTIARKVLVYSLVGNKYRRDNINWQLVV